MIQIDLTFTTLSLCIQTHELAGESKKIHVDIIILKLARESGLSPIPYYLLVSEASLVITR